MSRQTRMFEIIQLLRSASGPLTADAIASELEVTKRTVYRDIAALQARRVPVEGAAGIGYILRPGFDLAPLMFTAEEVEAIVVGLAMLRRSGDEDLMRMGARVSEKIASILPEHLNAAPPLHVSEWSDMVPSTVDLALIREAIRGETALLLCYRDRREAVTQRSVLPLALTYNVTTMLLLAWCEIREGFRHFRIDRIESCTLAGHGFSGQGDGLRTLWQIEADDDDFGG